MGTRDEAQRRAANLCLVLLPVLLHLRPQSVPLDLERLTLVLNGPRGGLRHLYQGGSHACNANDHLVQPRVSRLYAQPRSLDRSQQPGRDASSLWLLSYIES